MSEFNEGLSTNQISAGRIVAHGMVDSVATAFSLTNDIPFSIMVVPIASITADVIAVPDNSGVLISCKLSQDSASSDLPVMFGIWTEALIASIDIDAIDLEVYNVYWGTGGKS